MPELGRVEVNESAKRVGDGRPSMLTSADRDRDSSDPWMRRTERV